MNVRCSEIADMLVIEPDTSLDERGGFSVVFDADVLDAAGFSAGRLRCAIAANLAARTLRGLHYQAEPQAEAKLVCCIRGRVHDVVVDLRRRSPTYRRHVATELSGDRTTVLAVPPGCAHGYLTLTDDTILLYQISSPFVADLQRGIRWDDGGLSLAWPDRPLIISERDRTFPDHAW